MDAKLRRQCEMHAQLPEYKSKLEAARRIIAEALTVAPSWYVAFSTGKDSTVVLALAREQAPEIVAQHSRHQWMLPESVAYLASVPGVRQVAYQDFDGTTWAQRWDSQSAAEEVGALWLAKDQIATRGAPEAGVFLGLRAEESAARQAHLRTLGTLHQNQATGKWQCNPISWWSVRDVWAYIVSNNVSYNAAYDRLAEIGVPLAQQRIGPLAVERVLGYGQIALLKRGWPELWNRYAERYPEVRAYV